MISILNYGQVKNSELFARTETTTRVEGAVADILAAVRAEGDAALYRFCEQFDHAKLDSLAVSEEELAAAVAATDPDFLRILERAAANIRKFHEKQVRNSFVINDEDGVLMGQKIIPVDRAGL